MQSIQSVFKTSKCNECRLNYLEVDFITARQNGFCSTKCWLTFLGFSPITIGETEPAQMAVLMAIEAIEDVHANDLPVIDEKQVMPSPIAQINKQMVLNLIGQANINGFIKSKDKDHQVGIASLRIAISMLSLIDGGNELHDEIKKQTEDMPIKERRQAQLDMLNAHFKIEPIEQQGSMGDLFS